MLFYRFITYLLQCKVSILSYDVFAVSLTEKEPTHIYNILLVQNLTKNTNGKKFTICLSPMHSGFKDKHLFIQFIEIHKLLGVEKFVIYINNIDEEIEEYTRFYHDDNYIDILPWKIPRHVDAHYFCQDAMLNDCLYRYMFVSKYIAFVDLDEVIYLEMEPHGVI